MSTERATDRVSKSGGEGAPVAGALGPDTFRGRTRLERTVLPYLREQTLWPVLVAILAHVIALLAPLLVLGLRDGHRWSLLGVGVFAAASLAAVGFEFRERRRLGLVSAFIGCVWTLCAGGAFAVWYFEIV